MWCCAGVRVPWLLLAALVSFASLVCVSIFGARGVDNNRLFSVFDTRVVTYVETSEQSTMPESAAGAAVSTFVTAIEAASEQCNSSHVKRYSNPTARQTAITWNDSPAVSRYPVATGLDRKGWLFRWWAWTIYNFDAVAALSWVYSVSFVFQLIRYLNSIGYTCWQRRKNAVRPDGAETVPFMVPVQGPVYSAQPISAQVPLVGQVSRVTTNRGVFDTEPRSIEPIKIAKFSRWAEYALTSSVQILFFALLMQNTSVNQGVLMFWSQLLLCLLGYSVERELEDMVNNFVLKQDPGHRALDWSSVFRLVFLHLCPWGAHYTLWSIIIDDFWRYESDAQDCIVGLDGAPDAVQVIIYSQSIFFLSFGVTQLVHCLRFLYILKRGKNMQYDLLVEKNKSWNEQINTWYRILNVVSKFFIAVILVTNLADFSS